MEGLDIETITNLATLTISALIAVMLFFPKLRKEQAATAASSVAAAEGAVSSMSTLLGQHKQQIADLRFDLTQAQTQIATVERDSARKDVDHEKHARRQDERIEALEEQVREEKKKREEAERELEATKERVKKLEEWVRKNGGDPDEIVKKATGK